MKARRARPTTSRRSSSKRSSAPRWISRRSSGSSRSNAGRTIVCETGHGTLTVAYADGFGENVWRQVTKMEFIDQALTYPDIKKIIYTSAAGDATKAISDMRAYIAQKVDVIVIFADAGAALLPTVKEATEAGILVRSAQRHRCRRQAGQGLRDGHCREHLQARYRVRQDRRREHRRRIRRPSSNWAAPPAIRSAPPGRSAPTRRSPSIRS